MATIQPLPPVAVAQVKSSVLITSLQDVVLGLVENSLDSGATKVDVEVDFEKGFCSVEDDGAGIAPPDLGEGGGLDTSKPDDNPYQHGRKGIFLWAISALATLTVISLREPWMTTSGMTIHNGQRIRRDGSWEASALRHLQHGTLMEVRNLFGNMPVRVKQRPKTSDGSSQRAWKRTLKDLTGLLLAWGKSVDLSFKSLNGLQKARLPSTDRSAIPHSIQDALQPTDDLFHTATLKNILLHGASIDRNRWDQWVRTSARTSRWTIRALLSLEPGPSREVQFISLGYHYVKDSDMYHWLYDEINCIFENSSFGIPEDSAQASNPAENDRTIRRGGGISRLPKSNSKGVDKWPMFFFRIDDNATLSQGSSAADIALADEQTIIAALRLLIESFLLQNNMRVWKGRSKRATTATSLPRPIEQERSFDASKNGEDNPNFSSTLLSKPSVTSDPVRTSMRQGRGALSSLQTTDLSLAIRESLGNKVTASERVSSENASETTNDLTSKEIASSREPGKTACIWPQDHHSLEPPREIETETSDSSKFFSSTPQQTTNVKLSRTFSEMSKASDRTPWTSALLERWDNPVYAMTEEPITQIPYQNCTSTDLPVGSHSLRQQQQRSTPYELPTMQSKIRRHDLLGAKVISQVDRKFILIKIQTPADTSSQPIQHTDGTTNSTQGFLILVDQHAADERVRVETLYACLCRPVPAHLEDYRSPLGCGSAIDTEILPTVIGFELRTQECALFRDHAKYFAQWGILYALRHDSSEPCSSDHHSLFVLSLPTLISERCRADPKLLSNFLRRDAWVRHDRCQASDFAESARETDLKPGSFWSQLHSCPQGILDMINSRACRSAIMFNDELSILECERLVRQLAMCQSPFQCAHGRPSMIPVAETEAVSSIWEIERYSGVAAKGKSRNKGFLSAWNDWKA